ncbi:actin-related protein 8-like isoform X2 [Eurytemora carolleeae]|uniref:actin-related protein 8-like isoform X2 n=1 Tax=Eurytemora carolleeae TaxID=1294199 RepID=UPI000C7860A1|nr:actin-related protein 8-like isoform X2 [Eurytemora carolleeae]|eukprot:XP_023347660.1 actin-related protein 8-like isoform X2 [Eurytemora affinis]
MSLFQEELMDFGGSKYLTVMQQDSGDPEDPSDESYLTYTSRRYNKIGEIQVGEEQEFEDIDPLDQASVETGVEPAIPLDQAILRSINSIQSEDLRRKMLVNILLIGGGSNLSGLSEYLQNKLNSQVVGGVEILKETKECGVGNVYILY